MGKRSDGTFKRRKHDKYHTPPEPVRALAPYLRVGMPFVEPCAGKGQLVNILENTYGVNCELACDVKPQRKDIVKRDAMKLTRDMLDRRGVKVIITNPPWTRAILHPLIEHLMSLGRPVWLLFDADWAHTKQAKELLDHCQLYVSAGRVKWIPRSKHVGKDNAAWYCFRKNHHGGPIFRGAL